MDRLTFAATAGLEGNTLSGVVHTFGQRAAVGNRYVEFAPGAFDAALVGSDVRAFFNHNTDKLLGRQSSGTLKLEVGADGLRYAIDLPATSYADDLKVLLARGDLSEMSFGILPGKFTFTKATDGKQVQTHTSVQALFDVSPVALPAFAGTSVALHSQRYENETARSQRTKARARVQKEY